MRRRDLSLVALGIAWVVLGVAKLADPESSAALDPYLRHDVAVVVAQAVSILEVLLGAALFVRRFRIPSLLASLLLLTGYGTWAIVHADIQCNCAGRLVDLDPLGHSLLTAGMLLLTAHGLAVSREGVRAERAIVAFAFVGMAMSITAVLVLLDHERSFDKAEIEATYCAIEIPIPIERKLSYAKAPIDRRESRVRAGAVRRKHEILGRLEGASGTAVAQGEVWLAQSGDGLLLSGSREVACSGPDGAFALSAAKLGEGPWLCVRANGYARFCAPLDRVLSTGRPLTIVLDRGLSVAGTVIDGGGEAVPGATVEAWGPYGEEDAEGALFGPAAIPVRASAVTDERGAFVLSGLPNAPCRFHARAPGHLSRSYLKEPLLLTPGQQEDPPQLQLDKLYALRAVARDAATSEAIPTASYELQLRRGWRPAGGMTAYSPPPGGGCLYREGIGEVLCFVGADPSPVSLTVHAPGYETSIASLAPVAIPDSEGRGYCLALRRTADQWGRVSVSAAWPTGEPFSGPLLLHLLEPSGSKYLIPLVFDEGRAGTLALPAGAFKAWLQGLQGSTIVWRRPSGPDAYRLEVLPGEEARLSFRLHGCRVIVKPRTAASSVRSYRIGLPTVHLPTWASPVPFERSGSGVILYADPKLLEICIDKFGFEPARTRLDLEESEAVHWEPLLAERSSITR